MCYWTCNHRPDRERFLQLLLQDSQEGWGDQANPQPKFVQQVSHLGQIQHGDSQIHPDNWPASLDLKDAPCLHQEYRMVVPPCRQESIGPRGVWTRNPSISPSWWPKRSVRPSFGGPKNLSQAGLSTSPPYFTFTTDVEIEVLVTVKWGTRPICTKAFGPHMSTRHSRY